MEEEKENLIETRKSFFMAFKEWMKARKLDVVDVNFKPGISWLFEVEELDCIEFRVKQFPNWLFGLWFRDEGTCDSSNSLEAEIFWQYERFIDKFKPTASFFSYALEMQKGNEPNFKSQGLEDALRLMKKSPSLCFCKDVLCLDNCPRAKAWVLKAKNVLQDEFDRRRSHFIARKACRKLQRAFDSDYGKGFVEIQDIGTSWWPRYAPAFVKKTNLKAGYYDLDGLSKKGSGIEKYLKWAKKAKARSSKGFPGWLVSDCVFVPENLT